MPHVDEGTLHAYLDGAIDSLVAAGALPDDLTRTDIDAHLAVCDDCRALLTAERTIRDRAGVVLRSASGRPVVVPPFSEVRAGWAPSTPEIFERPRNYVPLAWAASVLLALGAGWYGALMRTPDAGPSVADLARQEAAPSAPPAVASLESVSSAAASVGGVPQRFREAVDSARNDGLVWRTVPASDVEAQALGVVNVAGADDMRVSIASLPNGLGSIARVQQRLDTGEPFELLVWREPAEVAAVLAANERMRLADARGAVTGSVRCLDRSVAANCGASVERASSAAARPSVAVLASDRLAEGEGRVLARVRDDMTFVAIHGAIEQRRLTGLADRLVDIR
jgi:hypothetical protein